MPQTSNGWHTLYDSGLHRTQHRATVVSDPTSGLSKVYIEKRYQSRKTVLGIPLWWRTTSSQVSFHPPGAPASFNPPSPF
jgi:hypothetical protein